MCVVRLFPHFNLQLMSELFKLYGMNLRITQVKLSLLLLTCVAMFGLAFAGEAATQTAVGLTPQEKNGKQI